VLQGAFWIACCFVQKSFFPQQIANMNRMKFLGLDVLLDIFSFLDCDDNISLGITSKVLYPISEADELWATLCATDYLIESKDDLPPGNDVKSDTHLTCKRLYFSWTDSFSDYSQAEVKVARSWWMRIERWLLKNAPKIFQTLNPPPKLVEIDAVEEELGRTIPRLVKLLYRFHDGQDLFFDRGQLDNTPVPRSHAVNESIFLGLFGGYSFYEEITNMRFLPLRHLVLVSDLILSAPNKVGLKRIEIPPPSTNISTKLESQNEDHIQPRLCRREAEECAIFACNAPLTDGITKIYLAADGEETSGCNPGYNDGVFVNYGSNFSNIISCTGTIDRTEGGNRVGGDLFRWLEVYLSRLEKGIYRLQPFDMSSPERTEPYPYYTIMLYPLPLQPITDPIYNEEEQKSPLNNYGYNIPKLSAIDGSEEMDYSTISSVVTNGVEITVSPVFIPEKSELAQTFWSYSIRMRLVKDHPSRPEGLTTCQLKSRHWLISEPVGGAQGMITGEGVIGQHPTLSIEYSQGGDIGRSEYPFVYQSCTTAHSYPGCMRGFLTFRCHNSLKLNRDADERFQLEEQRAFEENHRRGTYADANFAMNMSEASQGFQLFRVELGEFQLTIPKIIF